MTAEHPSPRDVSGGVAPCGRFRPPAPAPRSRAGTAVARRQHGREPARRGTRRAGDGSVARGRRGWSGHRSRWPSGASLRQMRDRSLAFSTRWPARRMARPGLERAWAGRVCASRPVSPPVSGPHRRRTLRSMQADAAPAISLLAPAGRPPFVGADPSVSLIVRGYRTGRGALLTQTRSRHPLSSSSAAEPPLAS